MEELYSLIEELLCYANNNLAINQKDIDYLRNKIYLSLQVKGSYVNFQNSQRDLNLILTNLYESIVKYRIMDEEKIPFYLDWLMGEISLSPYALEQIQTEHKLNFLYEYQKKNNYLKTILIANNPRFYSNDLIITINRIRPLKVTYASYPMCEICHQNEGYYFKHTLRTIDLKLNGEDWFWQFSPYGYCDGHGVAIAYQHQKMCVDKDTFQRLVDFVDIYPDYFIGSNASLSKIGGSILTHNHLQGGKERLPLHKKEAIFLASKLKCDIYVINWPLNVLKIIAEDKNNLINLCNIFLCSFLNYSNVKLGIISKDENGIHHGISPILIKNNGEYEMYLVFRSNICDEKNPYGKFNTKEEYFWIKSEAIGLMEAQGLFILPSSIEESLDLIKKSILSDLKPTNELKDFYYQVMKIYKEIKDVDLAIEKALGLVCYEILFNCCVFKNITDFTNFVLDSLS